MAFAPLFLRVPCISKFATAAIQNSFYAAIRVANFLPLCITEDVNQPVHYHCTLNPSKKNVAMFANLG
jgi:hypothetical protein